MNKELKSIINWKFIDNEKPQEDGIYLVLWSQPYHTETTTPALCWFTRGSFEGNPAGANEILYWAALPDPPKIPIELKRRRVINEINITVPRK